MNKDSYGVEIVPSVCCGGKTLFLVVGKDGNQYFYTAYVRAQARARKNITSFKEWKQRTEDQFGNEGKYAKLDEFLATTSDQDVKKMMKLGVKVT